MRRLLCLLLILTLLPLSMVMAQDEDEDDDADLVDEDVIEEPVEVNPGGLFGDALPILADARSDLELLAVTVLPSPVRPDGWSGSFDVTNPQLPLLLRLDLEILAAVTIGEFVRPADWFGAVPGTNYAIARDIRHDLELLADEIIGQGQRPDGWLGGNPIMRCNRATQTLIRMLERGGVFTLTVDRALPDFCKQAELQATVFSESNLLSTPGNQAIFTPAVQAAQPGAITVETDFAVAFLDTNAVLQVGVVPNGTVVTPVGRSTTQFSKMTLFTGDNFAVFLDYRDTTLSDEQFETLPDAAGVGVDTFCAARWCGAG